MTTGAGAGLRMVLHGEGGMICVFHTLNGAIIHRNMGYSDALALDGSRINCIDMVLGANLDPTAAQILNRLVDTAMAKLHLVGIGAVGQSHQLVTQANPENGTTADELLHVFDNIH